MAFAFSCMASTVQSVAQKIRHRLNFFVQPSSGGVCVSWRSVACLLYMIIKNVSGISISSSSTVGFLAEYCEDIRSLGTYIPGLPCWLLSFTMESWYDTIACEGMEEENSFGFIQSNGVMKVMHKNPFETLCLSSTAAEKTIFWRVEH